MQGDWMKDWLPKDRTPPGILQISSASLTDLEQVVNEAARSFRFLGTAMGGTSSVFIGANSTMLEDPDVRGDLTDLVDYSNPLRWNLRHSDGS